MKRQLTADKDVWIKQPPAPRALENQMAEFTEFMVDMMTLRFRNQAILSLDEKDIKKFADACADDDAQQFNDETGNYAKVFLKAANQVVRKMSQQFSDDRIEKFVKTKYKTADKKARQALYQQIEDTIGISTKDLIATEAMTATTNALMLETSQWVKKLRDDTLEAYTATTLRGMTLGMGIDDLLAELDQSAGQSRRRAQLTARQQVSNYMSVTGKIRAQNLGVTVGVWETSRDEAVRASHRARNGKEFNLSKGLYSAKDGKHLLPGVDHNCRCVTLYKIPTNG